ncbi:hypothetical protein RRG08_010718 [Elysia crispata]|uniref:Uncharacterized protein n=1 Tax=Elysia crispata TaxID=231223 RepID=A0AAE1A203_9GAST|nr:hypothetical protein RRG08_010718 [Elysia crispata]
MKSNKLSLWNCNALEWDSPLARAMLRKRWLTQNNTSILTKNLLESDKELSPVDIVAQLAPANCLDS